MSQQAARRSKNGPVEVRTVVPQLSEDEQPEPYYPPVPQIDGKIPFRVSYKMVTPVDARRMILDADSDPDFHQRLILERDIRRWQVLMETNRFVWYLPDGPLLYDPEGMLMNGKTRLTGLARQSNPQGFMIIHNVPRWMFAFFDTGRNRTINNVFQVAGRPTKGQTGPTVRLAMRYSEVLRGGRSTIGWQNWSIIKDEHSDVLSMRLANEGMLDLYLTAHQVYQTTKVNLSALMVWRYFQELAWTGKEAELKMAEFWDLLRQGNIAKVNDPLLRFREWAKETRTDKIRGKRELHLILLNRIFAMWMNKNELKRLTWAHGWPMNTPYHPSGTEIATKNVLKALDANAAALQ